MKAKEIFNDVLPLIREFAPSVGAALGGPFGAAAGYVLPILASSFGAQPMDPKGIVNNILQDADAGKKLQSIEATHAEWIQGLMQNMNDLAKAEINIKLEWEPAAKS